MFQKIVCGSSSFQHEEDDHSTQRKSSRSCCSKRKSNNKKSKNPYSNRGLDKFSNVVADLDERRQKIYDQMGSQDISMVRFGYSYSEEWTPIVVKVKDQATKKDHDKSIVHDDHGVESKDRRIALQASSSRTTKHEEMERKPSSLNQSAKEKKGLFSLVKWKEASCYFSMLVVVILVCLAIFGRSFAILCACIWWYLGPIVNGEDKSERGWMKKKKKDYVRRVVSEKKMESDAIGLTSPRSKSLGHGAPPKFVNTKSW